MSQPLVVVLGHKDHGKTALVSFIRNRAKAVPELRFVDTPGHTEYADLRKETGKLADLAILVVDLKKGIQEQTLESIELLENLNVPFVIAANKLDTIRRYKSQEGSFIGNFRNQDEKAKDTLGKKIKKIIEKLSKLGFKAERIDKIHNINEQICIIPTSAHTGEGVNEVLAVLAGMAHGQLEQKFKDAGFRVEKETMAGREVEIAQRLSTAQVQKIGNDELYLMISDGVFKIKKRNPTKGNLIEIKHPNFMPSFQRPVILKIYDPFHGTRSVNMAKQGNAVIYTENGNSQKMDVKMARFHLFEWLMGLGEKIIQIDANTREYMGAEYGDFPDVKLIGSKILEVFEGDPSYKIVVKGFTKNKLLRIWVQGNKVIVQDEVGKKDEYEIGNKYHQYYFKSKVNEFVKQVEGPTNLVFKAPVSLPSVPQKVEAPVKGKVSKTVKEKLSTKIKFKLPKFIKKETIKSELGDTEEKVFATENEVKKMEGSADFLVQFTRRMMNEEDLDKRADRLRKSLSYGKHTYQKVLPSDLKRVAWAFASAMKELSVERQKELLELIVDGGLRDHILDKLQRVEDPETMLKESLHRVEETMGKMDTVHRKEISKTLREVEKKLDGRPVREVKKLTKPEVNVVEKQKEPAVELKKKLEKPEIKEKVVVKEKEPALVKEINLESELEMAQRMVREIVARRMATELNMEESEVLDHLGDGHWISAPLAALNKTVKFGVTKKTIDEEVERIVKWIDDNLYEGMVDEFQEEFQNQA